jgi:hypothetical protein
LNKRKARGRITEEEANELFQKPLELLYRPPSRLDLVPVSSQHGGSWTDGAAVDSPKHRSVEHEQPAARVTDTDEVTPGATLGGDDAVPSTADSGPRPGVFQRWRSTARRIWQTTVRRTAPSASTPASASTSDLAARLEENLLEASRLAAELQKRHQEALTDHQRAISEIRDMVTLLVEQVAQPATRDVAPPDISPSAPAGEAQPQDVPVQDQPRRTPRRPKRGSKMTKPAEENVS